jgi:hypothetical protein
LIPYSDLNSYTQKVGFTKPAYTNAASQPVSPERRPCSGR